MKTQKSYLCRRTLLLAILFCCMLTAWAQADKRITVDFREKPAAEAMRDIQRLSGARIQFNSSDLRFNVTYKAKDQEAINVVRNIVAPHKLFVTLRGKDIIISSQDFTGQLSGRERVISGYVRDESGTIMRPKWGVSTRQKATWMILPSTIATMNRFMRRSAEQTFCW